VTVVAAAFLGCQQQSFISRIPQRGTPTMDRIRELCRDISAEYKRKAASSGGGGDLPQEIEEGNVEYKLQLLDPAPGAFSQWKLAQAEVSCI
jgi:hypothetical protein